jgi:hypothetical protein
VDGLAKKCYDVVVFLSVREAALSAAPSDFQPVKRKEYVLVSLVVPLEQQVPLVVLVEFEMSWQECDVTVLLELGEQEAGLGVSRYHLSCRSLAGNDVLPLVVVN